MLRSLEEAQATRPAAPAGAAPCDAEKARFCQSAKTIEEMVACVYGHWDQLSNVCKMQMIKSLEEAQPARPAVPAGPAPCDAEKARFCQSAKTIEEMVACVYGHWDQLSDGCKMQMVKSLEEAQALAARCDAEKARLCPGAKTIEEMVACVYGHLDQLSDECKTLMNKSLAAKVAGPAPH